MCWCGISNYICESIVFLIGQENNIVLISQPPAQRMPFDGKDSTSLDVWEEEETVILSKQCKSPCIIDYLYFLNSSGLAGVQKGSVVGRVIYHAKLWSGVIIELPLSSLCNIWMLSDLLKNYSSLHVTLPPCGYYKTPLQFTCAHLVSTQLTSLPRHLNMSPQEHFDPYPRADPALLKKEFAGKSVLITGGGYGIGSAIAKFFAEAGVAQIILVGRTEAKLKSTADSLASFKSTTTSFYQADISSKSDVKKLFDSLTISPDVLVNNAGFMATPANFIQADLDEYWEAFTINVYGTALVTQSFLRHREALKPSTPAVVISLNTIGAYSVRIPHLSSYGASKAALARWSEMIAVDVPETTARFISIHPGSVKTDMGIKSGLDGVFRGTDPKLAGDFVVWAASEEARFLNGRFAWVNWDVADLVAAKEEITRKDYYRTSLTV